MKYQTLSVVNPAGTRIAKGLKTIEVRQWKPDKLPLKNLLIVQNEQRLSSSGLTEDPNGVVVAIVDIIACTEWSEDLLKASCASYWEAGWIAWHIKNVRPINIPIAVPAKLRIYEAFLDIDPLSI